MICVGTGGIKPCVVSFGADQFSVPEQAKQQVSCVTGWVENDPPITLDGL